MKLQESVISKFRAALGRPGQGFAGVVACALLILVVEAIAALPLYAGDIDDSVRRIELKPPLAARVKAYRLSWMAFRPHRAPLLEQDAAVRPFMGDPEGPWRMPYRESERMLVAVPGNRVPHATLLNSEGAGVGWPEQDIIIDRDKIYKLCYNGELRVVGTWKEEYWSLFFEDDDYRDYYLSEERKVRRDMTILSIPEHYLLERRVKDAPWYQAISPLQKRYYDSDLDPQNLAKLLPNPETYPWRSVGLLRLGDDFHAWIQGKNTTLVSLDPQKAGNRVQKIDRLFGLSPEWGSPAVYGDLGWAFFSTPRGLVGDIEDKLTLTTPQGERELLEPIDICSAYATSGNPGCVCLAREGNRVRLISLDQSGQVVAQSKWYPKGAVVACGENTSRSSRMPFWLAQTIDPDTKTLHEDIYRLDPESGKIYRSFEFSSPWPEYKDSCYSLYGGKPYLYLEVEEGTGQIHELLELLGAAREKIKLRDPFHCEFTHGGKTYYYMRSRMNSGWSVFNADGEKQDPGFREFLRSRKSDGQDKGPDEITTEPWLTFPVDENDGAPKFRVFDTDEWEWRHKKVGTKRDWKEVLNSPLPVWKTLLACPTGYWLGSRSWEEDGEASFTIIYVDLRSESRRQP